MPDASISFPGVVGHAHATARLSRAIARGTLHHGLILMGPRGIGKAALARGLACALHCRVQPSVGCGTCDTCRRILGNLHPDVEWVTPDEPGGSIKVDVARELANRLQRDTFETGSDHHVVVLDPADALTEQAYNALLKSIEEPRPGVRFLMITSTPDNLLPTIRSRCLPVRLGPLPIEALDRVLDAVLEQRRAEAEAAGQEPSPPPDPERRALAVRLCGGSVGQALELLVDPSLPDVMTLVRAAMEAAAEGPAGIFGGDKGPLWSAWTQASGGSGPGRPARERAACGRAVDLWLLHLRERLRGEAGLPGLPATTTAGAAAEAGEVPRLLHQLDRLQALREGLLRNPNVRLALEQTLLELTA